MSKYIIIDSGALINVLNMYLDSFDTKYIPIGQNGLSDIVDMVDSECKKNNNAIIFLNADEQIADTDENILDIILWMRCKYKYNNPIVIYSIYSLGKLLQSNPKNYFIVSPGCIYKEDIYLINSV